MTDKDKQQLSIEIQHIFDSGANMIRVFNMVESFIDKRYIPAPTQDGTAEENIESYWIESDDLGGGMHLMVFKSDYIRAMHRYAAPLRSEIERLKSELAASVSPKLVLPSDEDKQNAYLNMYPEMEESDGFDDGFIEAWEAYESELRRLNPSLLK